MEDQKIQEKPTHVKPAFYSYVYEDLKVLAKEFGYNLVLHGSMNRDLDLIAIPWVDDPKPVFDFLDAASEYLGVGKSRNSDGMPYYLHSVLPGQRNTYAIEMNRGGRFNNYVDKQWYLDISFTPLPEQKTEKM